MKQNWKYLVTPLAIMLALLLTAGGLVGPVQQQQIGAIIKSGASSDTATVDATSKALRISQYDTAGVYRGKKATYRASTTARYATVVTANVPFFLIEGSASKTITVTRIRVTGPTLTAVQYLTINAVKYSTASTGGTANTLTQVPLDSSTAAGTASVVKAFTAAPTAGSVVGPVATNTILGQATTAAAAGVLSFAQIFNFSDMQETGGVVLRGTSQGLGLIWPTAPASAVTLGVDVEWTEE